MILARSAYRHSSRHRSIHLLAEESSRDDRWVMVCGERFDTAEFQSGEPSDVTCKKCLGTLA